jgi:phage tail sheath protein FI
MTEHLHPGVYIEEVPFSAHTIEGVSTTTAGFIGVSPQPRTSGTITSFTDFLRADAPPSSGYLSNAVKGFFDNDGRRCYVAWIAPTDAIEAGLRALSNEPVSILCCPDEHAFPNAAATLASHCEQRQDRMCILQSAQPDVPNAAHQPPVRSSYAAYYHPWVTVTGPGNATVTIPPGGHLAGIYARTDTTRGVWTAPADQLVRGVIALSQEIGPVDAEALANRGVNALSNLVGRGIVVSSARTASTTSEFKYVNVRRLLLFIEQSLNRGLQWTVFEPNGLLLWETVRAAIEVFLFGLWRSGALIGQRPEDAYFVRVDRTTMTQDDIDSGRLITLIGVAPLRPSEFVILRATCQNNRP